MQIQIKTVLPFILIFIYYFTISSQPRSELGEEICDDLRKTEKQLDSLVKVIKIRYSTDSLFLIKFAESQKFWKNYRKSQIEMKFPADDKQLEYGSLYPACFCLEKIRLTEQRADELKMWTTGKSDEYTCPGSVLIEGK